MSNKPKLKVFSFYMFFVFLVLLGAQYILLDLYSSRLFAFQENLLNLKTIQARPLVETLVLIAGLLFINILARFVIIRFGRKKLQIKKDMVEKYLNLPFTYYYDVNYAQVLDSLQSYPEFFINDVLKIYRLFFNAVICILIFIKLFSISAVLAALSLSLLFLFFLLDRFFLRLVRNIDKLRIKTAPSLYKELGDSVSGRLDIRSVNSHKYFEQGIFSKMDKLCNGCFKKKEGIAISRNNLERIIQKVLPLLSLLIALFLFKDKSAGNTIMPFYMLFILLPNPLSTISIFEHIKNLKTMIEPIEELLQKEEAKRGRALFINDGINVNSLTVNLRNQYLLNNVNLNIKQCEKVLIIGDSGSGKSVFLNCLMGAEYKQRGEVNYGSTEVKEFTLESFLTNTSFLDLKGLVLPGTLRYNLLLNTSEKISDEALEAFVHSIGVAEFIPFLHDLDTVLDPDTLSDGERVTVSLLRELIKKPQIFFLDETFSSLDVAVEDCFLKYLMSTDSTVIMISHKKEHVQYFERVLYFQAGNIRVDIKAKYALTNPPIKDFYSSVYEDMQKGEIL
ncbi:ATP-binding cassette domain-containing protein [Treponema sp. OMZ 792]|uniref:ATP-binding cassette domain-containing protein n=1 Tax=unclassified Treponema TaxID=2638727 RepID=UPI0020A27E99|nr:MULTISPECIES: ATP-binding cassette domain-containing protein [unclassified Treponema]UTC74830.1 ATP-binding cassette domain-containing protein [Treponema sp. OMZ 792]UTC81224.1 ATP-binding cassette domain-containing protein [Treponema sp. OMZ 798]